jgi:coenzyme F420-0:L-glutamate ligase/coenzyme F420-1:gamma-L-glutamate ligase
MPPVPVPPGHLAVVPLTGLPEVTDGDDLATLLVAALDRAGARLGDGDCLVVSSKVVSKALGLVTDSPRAEAVDAATRRVVAERRGTSGITRVVEAAAGPVMAAAGVDASNTGRADVVLLLPEDPDGEASRLREAVLASSGLVGSAAVGVVLSDTAGRPWRDGLTDFALGAAGLVVLEDLRGGSDADGRPLVVTARAVADEVAAAADLVKGKADGVPAALVRGLPREWLASGAAGARALVRTGATDWFALGHVEAVRSALGVEPGTDAADGVGVPATGPEDLSARVGRVVALALYGVPEGTADVAVTESRVSEAGEVDAPGDAEVTLSAPDDYELGRLVERTCVAGASERLVPEVTARGPASVTVVLRPSPPP